MEMVSIISDDDGEDERNAAEGHDQGHHQLPSIQPGTAFAPHILPVRLLYLVSVALSYHWWWCLDGFISLFIGTTEFKTDMSKLPIFVQRLLVFGKGLALLLLLVCLLPLASFSAIIWLPLQFFRPRSFSYCSPEGESCEKQSLLFSQPSAYQNITESSIQYSNQSNGLKSTVKKPYTLISGNVCLMPEFLARMNNVSDSVKRAEKISQLVCGNQIKSEPNKPYLNQQNRGSHRQDTEVLVKIASNGSEIGSSISSKFENESFYDEEVVSLDSSIDSRSISSVQVSVTSKERAVCEAFPKLADFLCLQEVFERRASDVLLKGLRSKYPYILYDVMWPIHHGKLSLLNSGLCIASKYPFLNVKFKAFPHGYREDKLACKGLLMTKVYLGKTEDGKVLTGYLATSHLQAITHTKASEVRCKQLNLLLRWLHNFKKKTSNNRHTVLFDIICGDFNFDHESHFEESERNCQFRQEYRDPCINEVSGQQHSWVVGTELIAEFMHESAVNSSRGLQRMLISELERPRYVASTAPSKGGITQNCDGRRKVDYILYKQCGDRRMIIKDFKFITGFATLTDHIPLSMTFSVDE